MLKKIFIIILLFNNFIFTYNCSNENLGKLNRSSSQELMNLVNSLVIRVFSSDAVIFNGIKDKNLVEWDSLLNCTLELVINSNKSKKLKDLYINYVKDIISLTNYLKKELDYLHNKYSKFFIFDKNQGILKIDPEIKLDNLQKDEILSYLNNIKAKIDVLTYMIKKLIKKINKSLSTELESKDIKNKFNFFSRFSVPKRFSKVLSTLQEYKNLKDKENLDSFFENIVKKYNKVRFFADDLNKLKDFLLKSENNIYNKLIPVIQNLINKIEEKYVYLAPLISEFDSQKILNTEDTISLIIFLESDNLKSVYGQIYSELTELIK